MKWRSLREASIIMSQITAASSNTAQIEYWNSSAGETWAQFQEPLDRQIAPLGLAAIDVLKPREGQHIIDIGCGCGQTTLSLASRVGVTGSVMGVDISKPMLEVALRRPRPAPNLPVTFRQLDAQTDDLGHNLFDAAFSRFGVMFFSDPATAFANIRTSLKHGGRLVFVCWRALSENPWMEVPLQAALPFLQPVEAPDPTAPGPFAFADASRVRTLLTGAGFGSVEISPFDAAIGGADIEQTLKLALRLGPLGRALREQPGSADAVAGAVRGVLSRYVTSDGVLMPAAVWIVQASNG
jgi:SAM-dependent methyltransferase